MTQVIFHIVMHQYNLKDFFKRCAKLKPKAESKSSKESWKKLFELRDGGISLVVPPDHQEIPDELTYNIETDSQTWRTNLFMVARGRVREAIVRKFGIEMYILLYFKWITNKTYCTSQETLLSVMCQAGWEGSLK